MRDIDVNVFLRKYAQEREVIRVKADLHLDSNIGGQFTLKKLKNLLYLTHVSCFPTVLQACCWLQCPMTLQIIHYE